MESPVGCRSRVVLALGRLSPKEEGRKEGGVLSSRLRLSVRFEPPVGQELT